jgi:hypothetical protein
MVPKIYWIFRTQCRLAMYMADAIYTGQVTRDKDISISECVDLANKFIEWCLENPIRVFQFAKFLCRCFSSEDCVKANGLCKHLLHGIYLQSKASYAQPTEDGEAEKYHPYYPGLKIYEEKALYGIIPDSEAIKHD